MSTVEEDIVIELDEAWVSCLEKRVADTNWEDWRTERPTIFKVPKHIRDNDPNAYEPVSISIGPYHHHKPHLQAMNQLKWHYLKKFLGRNPSRCLADYLKQMKKNERQARVAYSEELNMISSNDFVEMMLLDGCFVVETIVFWTYGVGELEALQNPIESTSWSLQVVARDMLMLENQLPFFLLQCLFDTAFPGGPGLLQVLTFKFSRVFIDINLALPSNTAGFQHILHLVHSCINIPAKNQGGVESSTSDNKQDGSESSTSRCHKLNKIMKSLSSEFCQSFLSWTNKLRCSRDGPEGTEQPTSQLGWIPNATKLNEFGIHFKRKKEATSFLDITFKNGKMEIPQLRVDDDTNTLLMNLIAFEQCYKGASPHLTAFASLMDCIINTAADVELLQENEIIISGLGNSEEVAVLFNKLCKEVIINHDGCYLSQVFKDVKKQCGTQGNKWRARLNHDYFSNPWSIISLFAAILLFVLATTQTIYSVLSYVVPRN